MPGPVVTQYFWVNDNANGLYNDAANWSLTTGGTGGAGVPGATEVAVFDGSCSDTCRIDTSMDVQGINLASDFAGIVDAATDGYSHSIGDQGISVNAGTIYLGSGTWTQTGGSVGINFESVATVTHNSGSLVITGTSAGATVYAEGHTLNNVEIASGISATVYIGGFSVDGSLRIESPCEITIIGDITINSGGYLGTGPAGSIVSASTNKITISAGASLNENAGTVMPYLLDVYGNRDGTSFVPGTYGATKFNAASDVTITLGSGTYWFYGDLTYSNTTSDTLTIDGATNDPDVNVTGALATVNSGGGNLVISLGDGTWTIDGAITLTAVTTFNANAGTVIMGGSSGTQIITFAGKTLNSLQMNSSGATKRLGATGFTAASLTLTAGTLDGATNNPAITVSGAASMSGAATWTMGNGTKTLGSVNFTSGTLTEGGGTINVAGNMNVQMTTLNRTAGTNWNLTASGTLAVGNSFSNGVTKITQANGITTTITGNVYFNAGSPNGLVTGNATSTIQDDGSARSVQLYSGSTVTHNGATITSTALDRLLFQFFNSNRSIGGNFGQAKIACQQASSTTFTVAANLTCGSFTVSQGALDCNTYNPTMAISGDLTLSAPSDAASLGNGTWTVAGNLNIAAVSTFSTSGTMVMSGAGKTLTTTQAQDFNNLTISGSVTVSGSLDVAAILTISGTLTLNTGGTYRLLTGSNLKVAGGTLTGTGTLGISGSAQISQQTGTISINGIDCSNITGAIVPATYGCTTFTFAGVATSTFTFSAGTYNFVNLQIRATGGSNTVDASVNNPTINVSGNLYSTLVAGATALLMGSGTWTVAGNVDLSYITTLTHGGSTLKMTGASKSFTGAAGNHGSIEITGSISATVGGTNLFVHGATVIRTGGSLSIASGKTWYQSLSNISIETGATFTGAGTIRMGNTNKIAQIDGTLTVAKLQFWQATNADPLIPGTYDCALLEALGSGSPYTLTMAAGSYTFTGNVSVLGTAAVNNSANNPNWTIHGNVSFTGTWTKGTGTITLAGTSGTQTVAFGGASVEAINVNCVGAVKQVGALGFTATSLTMTAGTLDCATNNPPINVGDVTATAGGTLDMGAGAWTISGNWNRDASVALTQGAAGSVNFTGAAKTITVGAHTAFNNATISGTISLTSWANVTFGGATFTISGTLTKGAAHSGQLVMNAAMSLAPGATITDAGSGNPFLRITSAAASIVQNAGTWDIDIATQRGFSMVAGTYKGFESNNYSSSTTHTWEAGSYVFTGACDFLGNGAPFVFDASANNPGFTFNDAVSVSGTASWVKGSGTITLSGAGSGTQDIDFAGSTIESLTINDAGATKRISAAGFSCGALTLTAGALDLASNNPDIDAAGNVSLAAGATYTKGTGTLTLTGAGSGTQTVDTGGHSLGPLAVSDIGATKRFTAGLTADWLQIQNGGFDANGQTFDIAGNAGFSPGTTIADLIGSTFNVGGAFSAQGAGLLDLLDLKASGTWYVNSTSDGAAQYVDVANSDASGGAPIYAADSLNSGSNLNWFFTNRPMKVLAEMMHKNENKPRIRFYRTTSGHLSGMN